MLRKYLVLFLALLGFSVSSQAVLVDLGNGLVNDTAQNITWLKDTNVFRTLCEAGDPIATEFEGPDPRDSFSSCSGSMVWENAEAWIARLNEHSYLGYNDWRQPITPQPDLTCETTFSGGGNGGYNCRGSELGHLFNAQPPAGLGNPNNLGSGIGIDGSIGTPATDCRRPPLFCFTETGPFISRPEMEFGYWSGTSASTSSAWVFHTFEGRQQRKFKGDSNPTVWPVRTGLINVLAGDVNGDGEISIGDVISVINAVLNPNGFENTDCNNDGVLDIGDVICTINLILG